MATIYLFRKLRSAAFFLLVGLVTVTATAQQEGAEQDFAGGILELSRTQDQDAFVTVATLLKRNMAHSVSLLEGYSLRSINVSQPEGGPDSDGFVGELETIAEESGYDFLVGGTIDWSQEGGYQVSLFVFDRTEAEITAEIEESADSMIGFFDIAETVGAVVGQAVTGEVIAFGSLEFAFSGYDAELEADINGERITDITDGLASIPVGEHEIHIVQEVDQREFVVHRETVTIEQGQTTTVAAAISSVPDELRLERNREALDELREHADATGASAVGDTASNESGATLLRHNETFERMRSSGASHPTLQQATFLRESQPLPYEGRDLIESHGAYSERENIIPDFDYRMVHVDIPEGGVRFPMGREDEDEGHVDNSFWISETYVTKELWDAVSDWADPVYGEPEGAPGEGKGAYDLGTNPQSMPSGDYPVKGMTWRGAMAWTNALTEWYNAHYGADLTPVYYRDEGYEEPIRRVSRAQTLLEDPGDDDNPYVREDADGFRMVTTEEWELAARFIGPERPGQSPLSAQAIYRDGIYWAPGNYASGAYAPAVEHGVDFDQVSDLNPEETGRVAWYFANTSQDQPVATRDPNWLGLYDMAGHLREKVFEWRHDYDQDGAVGEGSRIVRGGDYDQENLGWTQVGHESSGGDAGIPYWEANHTFRVARTSPQRR